MQTALSLRLQASSRVSHSQDKIVHSLLDMCLYLLASFEKWLSNPFRYLPCPYHPPYRISYRKPPQLTKFQRPQILAVLKSYLDDSLTLSMTTRALQGSVVVMYACLEDSCRRYNTDIARRPSSDFQCFEAQHRQKNGNALGSPTFSALT